MGHIKITRHPMAGPITDSLKTINKRHGDKQLDELVPDKQPPLDDDEAVKAQKLIEQFLKGKRK